MGSSASADEKPSTPPKSNGGAPSKAPSTNRNKGKSHISFHLLNIVECLNLIIYVDVSLSPIKSNDAMKSHCSILLQ